MRLFKDGKAGGIHSMSFFAAENNARVTRVLISSSVLVVLNQRCFLSPRNLSYRRQLSIFGFIFSWHNLREGLLASSEQRAGVMLIILQCTGLLCAKNHAVKNVNSSQTEKPGLFWIICYSYGFQKSYNFHRVLVFHSTNY